MITDAQFPTYDLFSPEALANPYALYKQMQETDPAYYSDSLGCWIVTRYQEVEAALKDYCGNFWGARRRSRQPN
jgi:cytochrome P450